MREGGERRLQLCDVDGLPRVGLPRRYKFTDDHFDLSSAEMLKS